MERLTYKLNAEEQKEHRSKYIQFEYLPIPDYDIEHGNYDRITTDMIYNKLGKLEDLEEQIGCPLEVIAKASQNGIWVKDKWQGIKHISSDDLNISIRNDDVIFQELYYEDLDSVMDTTGRRYYGSDYKKTWWFKKYKSE